MEKINVLVVDDDAFIRDVVKTILVQDGYEVKEATNGQEAFAMITKHAPHLMILDYMMPEMDGYSLCMKLKADAQYRSLPIIMLTAKDSMEDRIKLLDAGVDDYILKPFEPRELAARIKVVLRRVLNSLDAHPLTRLPGDAAVSREIENRIQQDVPLAVCSIELSDFKAYNERYGFEHGNRLIREIAQMIKKVVENVGNEKDFIGHIGGVSFFVITTPDIVDRFCAELINRFDLFIFGFYSPEDQKKGYILANNRDGDLVRFPIMSMQVSVATNEKQKLFSTSQISNIMAKLKEKTRFGPQSRYMKG
ncbi:MAG: response regulator [bacterium]